MDDDGLSAHIADPARLAALRAMALLDTPTEEAFDRLSSLAARFVNAPISLVSLIDADRQFFKSCIGLPEPWASQQETPLSHSFCQYNRIAKKPLLVEDARTHPLFKDNLAIRDLNVIAYLGIPLVTSDGYVLGSFCVIDSQPRHWTEEDVSVVERLAAAVMTEIQLRTETAARQQTEEKLIAQNVELRKAYRDLEKETAEHLRVSNELRQKDQMLIQQSRLAAMGEMINSIAHQWRQPLNVVGMQLQQLLMFYDMGRFDRDFLQDSTDAAMKQIMHMSKTIDDFGDFFKSKGDKAPFSVNEAIETTVSLIRDGFRSSGIEIIIDLDDGGEVSGYLNEFRQALLSIVQNAREALLERDVKTARIAIASAVEDGRLVVTVTDNAGGLPEEILPHIFEPYFSTKGVQGTGIGLYMAKSIIETRMGGNITAFNAGEGAAFRIELAAERRRSKQ